MEHKFTVGLKLECLYPVSHRGAQSIPIMPTFEGSSVYPATVTRVVNAHYFIVELDVISQGQEFTPLQQPSIKMCCHSRSSEIFPVGFCSSHDINLATMSSGNYFI